MPALMPLSKINLHILSIIALLFLADVLPGQPLPLDSKVEGAGYTVLPS